MKSKKPPKNMLKIAACSIVSCLGCRSNLDSAFLFAFLNTTCWGNSLAFVLNYVHILKKQVGDINITHPTAPQAAPFCLKRHEASSSWLLHCLSHILLKPHSLHFCLRKHCWRAMIAFSYPVQQDCHPTICWKKRRRRRGSRGKGLNAGSRQMRHSDFSAVKEGLEPQE